MNDKDKEKLYITFERVIKLKFNRAFCLCDEIGIHPGQNHLLTFLHRRPGQSQKQIADMLNIKPSTVTIMIKKMEKLNLVKRIPDDIDQRIIRVYLADEGEKICEKLIKVNNEIQEDCFKDFKEDEVREMQKFLDKMQENLEKVKDDKLLQESIERHIKCHSMRNNK